MLQGVAVLCSVLRLRAVCCSVLHLHGRVGDSLNRVDVRVAGCCRGLQRVAEWCRMLQRVAGYYRVLQGVAVCCSVLHLHSGVGDGLDLSTLRMFDACLYLCRVRDL